MKNQHGKLFIIIVILLITGCSHAPFYSTEFNSDIRAKIIIDDSIYVNGLDANGKFNKTVVGMAECYKGNCVLHLPTLNWIDDSYNLCVWGHELAHAVHGNWHREGEPDTCGFYKK